MENDDDQIFNVVITYSTHASSIEEALKLAEDAITNKNGGYVEVFNDGEEKAVLEEEWPNAISGQELKP